MTLAGIIAFLTSRVGQYVIIAALAAGLLVGIRQSGVNSERRKCEAAAAQRRIEINNRDIKIGELQSKLDKQISSDIAKNQEIENAYQSKLEAELAKRPVADQCRATPADIERLR